MQKPVWLPTVQEVHKEYNSLIDQIRAKNRILDSGECGNIDTPTECWMLQSRLLACMNCAAIWMCQCPRNLTGPSLQTLKWSKFEIYLFLAGSVRVFRMKICHRYVRTTSQEVSRCRTRGESQGMCNTYAHFGFKTQRCHQTSNTGLLVTQQKGHMSSKFFF